jgi:hypothetical protein
MAPYGHVRWRHKPIVGPPRTPVVNSIVGVLPAISEHRRDQNTCPAPVCHESTYHPCIELSRPDRCTQDPPAISVVARGSLVRLSTPEVLRQFERDPESLPGMSWNREWRQLFLGRPIYAWTHFLLGKRHRDSTPGRAYGPQRRVAAPVDRAISKIHSLPAKSGQPGCQMVASYRPFVM